MVYEIHCGTATGADASMRAINENRDAVMLHLEMMGPVAAVISRTSMRSTTKANTLYARRDGTMVRQNMAAVELEQDDDAPADEGTLVKC